jgi:RecJ-like exonuclease
MGTFILTHGDTDGICAGALALVLHPDANLLFTNPYRLVDNLKKIPLGDNVIICDVSLQEVQTTQILEHFSKISEKGSLTYIDHHPLPNIIRKEDIPGKVLHDLKFSTAEQAYSLYKSGLDPLQARNAIYGAISDYLDHTTQIQRLLKRWDKRTLYLETGILVQGVESLGGDNIFKRKIVNNLAVNIPPSQDTELVNLAVQYTKKEWEAVNALKNWTKIDNRIAYTLDFPFSLGKTATYLSGIQDILVGIAGEKRGENIDMSLRTSNENIDLNSILRKITPALGGKGGGHPSAAGARIPEKNFEKLLWKINTIINK